MWKHSIFHSWPSRLSFIWWSNLCIHASGRRTKWTLSRCLSPKIILYGWWTQGRDSPTPGFAWCGVVLFPLLPLWVRLRLLHVALPRFRAPRQFSHSLPTLLRRTDCLYVFHIVRAAAAFTDCFTFFKWVLFGGQSLGRFLNVLVHILTGCTLDAEEKGLGKLLWFIFLSF